MLAMKYLTAPKRVESGSSGSTVREFSHFFFFLLLVSFLFSSLGRIQTSWDRRFSVYFFFPVRSESMTCFVFCFFWLNEYTNFGSTHGRVELAGVSLR